MKFKSKTLTAIVLAAILVVGTMTVFAANSLTAEADNNGNISRTVVGSDAKIVERSGNEKPITDEQVNFAGQLLPDDNGELNFSLNDALTLDGINLIVNPRNWGISEIFDVNGNIRNDGEITWSFTEINEETYRGFESQVAGLENYPLLPTYTDEEWTKIKSDIENGIIKPINPADIPKGAEVFFYDGENIYRIGG